ncbi:uncharacterized protein ColSpa_06883 [Colletotrichum spaethianum]|uniref:Uncharacterized protein n=1 Tax=Colletotrichum spaethianum TaxID=700344 RepID=A0AA37NYX6_9PEZI|nr:uncharacterized protein ColSpa_06883 [Colletotrichum spaethianum]GKT46702.1 hypothetical protein ColSpa_06883 [Colletotrichum spaethianum]
MTSMSLFAGTLRRAFDSPSREMLFDPEAFIEEWLWCEYQLVRYPGPLRSDCLSACRGLPDRLFIAADLGSSEAVAEAMIRCRHVQPTPSHVGNPLEPATRTAAIVYIEALVPDEPGNPLVHAVLLNLLSTSVRNIIRSLQERQSETRNENQWTQSGDEGYGDKLPTVAASKPLLIWVCLVGSVVAKLYETKLITLGITFDRDCYGQCFSMVVGSEPENVDQLQDEDLTLCKMLDVRGLRIKPYDERVLLKALLREHVYGVPMLDLAYV